MRDFIQSISIAECIVTEQTHALAYSMQLGRPWIHTSGAAPSLNEETTYPRQARNTARRTKRTSKADRRHHQQNRRRQVHRPEGGRQLDLVLSGPRITMDDALTGATHSTASPCNSKPQPQPASMNHKLTSDIGHSLQRQCLQGKTDIVGVVEITLGLQF